MEQTSAVQALLTINLDHFNQCSITFPTRADVAFFHCLMHQMLFTRRYEAANNSRHFSIDYISKRGIEISTSRRS